MVHASLEGGLEHAADPKHRVEVMKMTGLKNDSKAMRSAASKNKNANNDDEEELARDEVTKYRAAAA